MGTTDRRGDFGDTRRAVGSGHLIYFGRLRMIHGRVIRPIWWVDQASPAAIANSAAADQVDRVEGRHRSGYRNWGPFAEGQCDGRAGSFLEDLVTATTGVWVKSVQVRTIKCDVAADQAMAQIVLAAARSLAAGFVLWEPGHFTDGHQRHGLCLS